MGSWLVKSAQVSKTSSRKMTPKNAVTSHENTLPMVFIKAASPPSIQPFPQDPGAGDYIAHLAALGVLRGRRPGATWIRRTPRAALLRPAAWPAPVPVA